jgi:hypothetical protein
MSTFFTRKGIAAIVAAIPFWGAVTAGAQDNIAPAATVRHHDGQIGGGIGLQSAHNYNDGYIGSYPGTFTGYVNPEGFIEFEWPNLQRFNRVVVYKGARAFESAILEYWDGSQYQTITQFPSSAPEADSVSFGTVATTKLRISNIANGRREPSDFREIIVRQAPDRACNGAASVSNVYPLEQTRCLGDEALLIAGDYTFGASYQWQVYSGSSWIDIPGATGTWYRFRVTSATPANTEYRLAASCGAGSPTYSPTARVIVGGGNNASFAALPFSEDFEKVPWQDACGTGDVPSEHWISTNIPGPHKWVASNVPSSKNPFPAIASGQYAARFTSQFATATVYTANLDLHVDCSVQPGNHRLEFLYVNPPDPKAPNPGSDFLVVYVSEDGGANFIPVAGWEDQDVWDQKTILFSSGSPNTIIRFRGFTQSIPGVRETTDFGIDDVFVKAVDPCSGTPATATVTPGGPLNLCAGTATTLSASNVDQVPGISLQWEQSLNGTTWTSVVGGSGATTPVYNTPNLYDTVWYRLKVSCAGHGQSVSSPVAIYTPSPVYASIPFMESFESWVSRCDTLRDVPSLSWINTPAQGSASWRREDEGNVPWGFTTKWDPSVGGNVFANWSASYGKYPDPSFHGDHSARFHSYGSKSKSGTLDLFVDCSTFPGDKELRFALNLTKDIPANVNNPNPAPNGYDYLNVYLSTDGGASFTLLQKIAGPAFSTWEIKSITVPSTSPTTVIRFEAHSVTGYKDMGLDYVRVLPGCTQQPVAGTIDDVSPCPNKDFFLRLSGSSQSTNLVYQWQRSTDGVSWINMPGTGSDVYTTQIADSTWFRVIVTCSGSGLADTTPVRLVKPANFFYCYCESGFNSERTLNYNYALINCGKNIGNVTITNMAQDTVLKNGNYVPWFSHPEPDMTGGYSDFRKTVPPAPLYLDSTYDFTIHSIHTSTVGSNPVKWAAYIDFNRDGLYDTASERIWMDLTKNTDTRYGGSPYDTYSFSVPANAKVGVTGMRVVMMGGSCTAIADWNGGPHPCSVYGDGETEDYLVEIKYPECNGSVSAGQTVISDTLLCPGYDVVLTNTTHESQRSGISWDWQHSADGSTWTTIAGSAAKDVLTQTVNGASWYRLRVVCDNTSSTSYSNVVRVRMKEPYRCYCFSMATGGAKDSSDIGRTTIGGKVFGAAGPHLNNTAAVNGRTDNTDSVMYIESGSKLSVALSHILRSSRHADAKVTVFIDYNNNLQYDIPSERVWSTTTAASAYNLADTIMIPTNVVTDVPTGMRIILNNDTDPNVPSDEACGPYVSGETEDYVVVFTQASNVGVASVATSIKAVYVYPNPTSGKVFVQYFGDNQENATISVLNATGQILHSERLSQVTNRSVFELNLSHLASGVYYVHFTTPTGQVNQKLTLIGR